MRSNKTFLFFITDSQGRSAYWEDDVVKWQTTPRPLRHAPDGWKDTEIGFVRSNKYFGINRQFTNQYKFVEDGASILRYLAYIETSYETKVYLIVTKWDDLNDIYKTYYRGEIDLVKMQDDVSTGVTANMIEGDILKLINSNDETEYEIPLIDREAVQMDPVSLANLARYSFFNVEVSNSSHYIPIIFLSVDQTLPGFQYQGQNDVVVPDSSFFFYTELPQQIRLTGSIAATRANDGFYSASYTVRTSAGDVDTSIVNSLPVVADTPFNVPIDIVIDMPAQSELILFGAFAGTNSNGTYLESPLQITFDYNHPSSLCLAIKPKDLLSELLQKVCGTQVFILEADLLEDNEHLLVTSGDGIREAENAVIKTSLSKFFAAFNKILFAGMGVNGLNVTFDGRLSFYDDLTDTIDLGEVSEMQISIAEDQLANTAKIGYPQQDIETLNGKFSFNNTNQFSLPVTKVKKEYEQVSEYLTDPYVIENLRANFSGRNTTDQKNDNTTFVLNTVDPLPGFTGVDLAYGGINGFLFRFDDFEDNIGSFSVGTVFRVVNGSNGSDGIYRVNAVGIVLGNLIVSVDPNPNETFVASDTADIEFIRTLKRLAYDVLEGVPATSNVYNIEQLTPKRMLFAHAPYYRSLLYFLSEEKMVFNTAERNQDLATEIGSIRIAEKDDVRADELGDPMFYPYIFSFKTQVPINFNELFVNAVNGHVAFKYNGTQLYGFPINLKVKPGLNEAQEWKLLASPKNDLQDLVQLLSNPLQSIDMSTFGLSFSKLCPVQFVPQNVAMLPPYNFHHMDAWTFKEQCKRYDGYRPYSQKWQTSDIIAIQCITRDLGPVQIEAYSVEGKLIGIYPLSQILTTAVSDPYQLYEGDINLQTFDPGLYYLKAVAGIEGAKVVFVSECLNIQDQWPLTLFLEYTNSRNQAATIFSTGYSPAMRVEGNIIDFIPRSRVAMYEDQPANMFMLDGTPYRQFTLFVGDSFGLPNYMADKVNRIFTLNSVKIDGKSFVRDEDAQMEPVNRVNGLPGTWWRMGIREAFNKDAISQDTDGELNGGAILVNVDSAQFGDLVDQVDSNPVQIELLEDL